MRQVARHRAHTRTVHSEVEGIAGQHDYCSLGPYHFFLPPSFAKKSCCCKTTVFPPTQLREKSCCCKTTVFLLRRQHGAITAASSAPTATGHRHLVRASRSCVARAHSRVLHQPSARVSCTQSMQDQNYVAVFHGKHNLAWYYSHTVRVAAPALQRGAPAPSTSHTAATSCSTTTWARRCGLSSAPPLATLPASSCCAQ